MYILRFVIKSTDNSESNLVNLIFFFQTIFSNFPLIFIFFLQGLNIHSWLYALKTLSLFFLKSLITLKYFKTADNKSRLHNEYHSLNLILA